MLELRERDLDAFIAAPRTAYGEDSAYVPPLDGDVRRFLDAGTNPLFSRRFGHRTFFTVHRRGVPVGRITAHVHTRSNERFGWRRAYFGFFDCADDPEAARLLLEAAERYAREHGCTELMGNFNLTAMQQLGVVTDGFDAVPYADQVYNPPHIPRLLEALGFERTFPMSTFQLDLRTFDPDALLSDRGRARLHDPALRWARIRRRSLRTTLESVRGVLNDGFRDNPMFVPLTAEEMWFQAKDLALVVDPRISVLVHDAQGPAGAVVCIPDLNVLLRALGSRIGWTAPYHFLRFRLRRRRAVIVFYSVAQRMQNRGLNNAMLHRVTRALRSAGYERLGLTWIADENVPSLRQAERLGAEPMHRLHLFRKAVSACD